MTAAIGRIVQETGSIAPTAEGPPWCHEVMTTLDSYLTLGRSGRAANLDGLVGLSCVKNLAALQCGAWSRKRNGQWAGRRPSGSARGGARYSWSAGAYERPMIRPSGD